MVDDKVANLLEWCRREREYLQMQREMLESGTFRISSLDEGDSVDESRKSIESITSNLNELDRLLAEFT